jgi:hypothetical protein
MESEAQTCPSVKVVGPFCIREIGRLLDLALSMVTAISIGRDRWYCRLAMKALSGVEEDMFCLLEDVLEICGLQIAAR